MLHDLKAQFGSSMHTVRRFLERPISMQQGNLRLGTAAAIERADQREKRRLRLRAMQRELHALLEQHPDSRTVMRHLDLVEKTLRRQGLKGVEALPNRVLTRALRELERLVWDWSSPGLAEFRSRLAVMIKTRPAEPQRDAAGADASGGPDLATAEHAPSRPSQIDAGAVSELSEADVSEVDHSLFEEMERSWAGRLPEGVSPGR